MLAALCGSTNCDYCRRQRPLRWSPAHGVFLLLATDTVLDHVLAEPRVNVVLAPFMGLQDTLRACATPVQLQCHARVAERVDLLKPRTVHTALNQDSTGPGMGFLPQPRRWCTLAWPLRCSTPHGTTVARPNSLRTR